MLSPYDRMSGRSIRRVSILLSHEILAGKCAIREPQISIIPNHGEEPIGGLRSVRIRMLSTNLRRRAPQRS